MINYVETNKQLSEKREKMLSEIGKFTLSPNGSERRDNAEICGGDLHYPIMTVITPDGKCPGGFKLQWKVVNQIYEYIKQTDRKQPVKLSFKKQYITFMP